MIVLCHGSDTYRIRAAADAEARATGVVPARLKLSDADARDELERILKYPSFLQEHRTVIVTDALCDASLPDVLRESGAHELSDTTVIACIATGTKPTAEISKGIAALGRLSVRIHECKPLTGAALGAWMREYCTTNGWRIDADAQRLLLERTGGDSWTLATELEKLAAYGRGTVTADAVALLVTEPAAQDQWELSNALAAHDKRRALSVLFERIRVGTPGPLLLGGIAASVRTLLMVRDLAERGTNASAIAATTGLHPFVVSKSLSGARAYDLASLKTALEELSELDRSSKSGDADAVDGMFGILLNLA